MPIDRNILRQRRWRAWAGSIESLRRIFTEMQARVADETDAALQNVNSELEYRLNEIARDEDFALRTVTDERVRDGIRERHAGLRSTQEGLARAGRERAWAETAVRFEVYEGRDRSFAFPDDAEELLEDFEPARVTEVRLETSRRASKRLSFVLDGKGCTLTVEGSDRDWVEASFTALADRVGRGAQWWDVLFHPAAVVAYVVAIGAAGAGIGALGEPGLIVVGGMMGGFIGFTAGMGLTEKIPGLPHFEIVRAGDASRGSRAFGYMASLGVATGLPWIASIAWTMAF